MFLDSNRILYMGMIQVIKRGTAEILEENECGVFLRDITSNTFMLATDNPENGIEWLKKYEKLKYSLMSVFQTEIVDFAREQYGFSNVFECFQAVYQSSEPPAICGNLQIRAASAKDLKKIAAYYDKLDEWELKEIIQNKELFIGYHDEEMVGFVGQHLEGSMGVLEVLPQYRRKGYGEELEKFMITHMLEEKMIPFCQIEVENKKSLELQKKLGLTISEKPVYWLFC